VFTGIVEERGRVRSFDAETDGARLEIECRTVAGDSDVGASVAVNGVCLTVVAAGHGTLAFDVAAETRSRSTLDLLRPGDPVNLERPLTLTSRLGGHLVQGHVDGVGTVTAVDRRPADGAVMGIRPPGGLERYVVEKGSIAVDGVSLTVAGVDDDGFRVLPIPHTLAATALGEREAGDGVNLEVDVVAKYVERLLGRTA
jgi:riboflavin synthase